MKYAIPYTKDFRHLSEVDEIIISNYTGTDQIIDFISSIVKDKQKQRIIINIADIKTTEDEVIIYLNKLQAEGFNIAVQIYQNNELIKKLKEHNIPFMFLNFAGSFSSAYSQAKIGASDVYIVEDLGFRMKDIADLKTQFDIQIRVFPNIAQTNSTQLRQIPAIQKFWIRPEDTELYEPYVDVFEIFGEAQLSVVYEIYKDRQWVGDLDDIILDFFPNSEIVPNGSMAPHIGEQRLNCGQACLRGKCNLCEESAKLAKTLEDADVLVIKDKYKPQLTKEEKEEILRNFEDKLNEIRSNEKTV